MNPFKRNNYSHLWMLLIVLAILSKPIYSVYNNSSLKSDSISLEMDFESEKATSDSDIDLEFGDYFIHPIVEFNFNFTYSIEKAILITPIAEIKFSIQTPPPDLDLFVS